ncbi:MAG: N-6 DNA methylase, partial [Candidatus Kapabacteria bacterium]|nr:N-6 DNA methylase [Candidatus Kapabacteria bacterium]
MTLQEYIDKINTRFSAGTATEHTYRGDLQQLIESLVPGISATNEPKRIQCGAPDYVLSKGEIDVGYIEAKDIGEPLDGKKKHKEQFDRYKKSLSNLIFTDYLDFWLFLDAQLVTSVRIAEIINGKIVGIPANYARFESLLKEFCVQVSQTITSSLKLAEMMADKAKLLAQVIELALTSDVENEEDSTLKEQMVAFREILIHDIKPKEFADIYAQTIAYGMFAARLHDRTLDNFSRQEAASLIPKSNPFLRKLFQYISGYDIDSRIEWIVNALADIFRATDVADLLKNFGRSTQTQDPIIHFYETFLAKYDPKLRKARGVWYTPEPVVNFIVRAVDDILKSEFGLPKGLADTAKTKIMVNTQTPDKRSATGFKQQEKEVHRVQILDPATGTGTFLAETVKHIYNNHFKMMKGMWSGYVENELIPRLNGFELLMASYSMAHLKMDLLLQETGYVAQKEQRFRIYLTNSLEEHHKDTGTLFASWLSNEANEANHIKRDTPVMVVMGNPPYSGISMNKGAWITNLINDYKYIDGLYFNEKKHWLNDDYVKFIRFGQHFIDKNGEGVLAFINPHGFLDNPTFRGMRWNLLKSFDKIYTIDLHGNTKKHEISPDGSKDENVFDITQGVSINIFVKTGNKKKGELGSVFHYDVYGKRNIKYNFLLESTLDSISFKKIETLTPNFFFIPQKTKFLEKYQKGMLTSDLFLVQSMGITSARDNFVVDFEESKINDRVIDFCDKSMTDIDFQSKYNLKENYQWKIKEQRK